MNNLRNVCIIDDDEIYQYTTTRTIDLLNLGTTTCVFSDGEEALGFIEEHLDKEEELPDIILLDINMPIMDGFQFMEEYAQLKPRIAKDIAVYMVSSSVDPIDIESAKKVPQIMDYIVKPINKEDLKSIIEKSMEGRN